MSFHFHDFPKPIEEPVKATNHVKPKVKLLLLTMFLTNCAVYVSSPFFGPFMLKELHLDFVTYNILLGSSLLARAFSAYLGKTLVTKKGALPLYRFGAFMIVPLPIIWNFTQELPFLILFQVLSGFAWGCHEMGLTLTLIERFSHKDRAKVLVYANVVNALGILCGVTLASFFIGSMTLGSSDYQRLFTISTCLRALPFVLTFFLFHSMSKNIPPAPQEELSLARVD